MKQNPNNWIKTITLIIASILPPLFALFYSWTSNNGCDIDTLEKSPVKMLLLIDLRAFISELKGSKDRTKLWLWQHHSWTKMELLDTGSEHVSEISKCNCKYVHFICLLVGCFLFFCNFVITRVGLCGCPAAAMSSQLRGWWTLTSRGHIFKYPRDKKERAKIERKKKQK